MEQIKFSCHFSDIGWSQYQGNYGIYWFENKQIEAIKLQSGGAEIKCYIRNKNGESLGVANGEIIGTVGKSIPVTGIKLESEKNIRDSIFYRVCVHVNGWGKVCSLGEWSGNDNNVIEGIQIWTLTEGIEKEVALSIADKKLKEYEEQRDRVFVSNPERFLLDATFNYENVKKGSVKDVINGIMLPLKKHDIWGLNGYFSGGVCNEKFEFIAGIDRYAGKSGNLTCLESYKVNEKDLVERNETVIFGGIINKWFGHLMTESLARMWYVVENPEIQHKIAVLVYPGHEDFSREIFRLMGINEQRLEIISVPTKFNKIIVPDEAFRISADYNKKFNSVYDYIRDNIKSSEYEKIYLTRTAFNKSDGANAGFNEEYFEEFYKRRGYTIISPEKYSLEQQISIISGAKEIVCTIGTLSHMAVLYCASNAKVTILRRTETILKTQTLIDKLRGIETEYIDVYLSFLPTQHWDGVYLYGPTKYWVEYLKKKRISYDEEELRYDYSSFYHYLKKWCQNYNQYTLFYKISDIDLYDILNNLNKLFGMSTVSKKKYITKVKEKEKMLAEENALLKRKEEEYKKKIDVLEGKLNRIQQFLDGND